MLEKGTTNGTITDFDGKFTLNLSSPDAVLVFSYIGYVTQEISAKNQNELKVVLKEDAEKLDEVVVIGYGAVRKADVAGAVAVLDNKSFKDQPITQVSDALQGRVSGVQVENSGVPGGSVKIRVRGSGSINKSNDPLYVVDGIVRESGLDGINPEDIQSMQVLKDASSTPYTVRVVPTVWYWLLQRPVKRELHRLLWTLRLEWLMCISVMTC